MDIKNLRIRRLQRPDEARACARLMASSEPWIKLQRDYDFAMKRLSDPAREVHIAKLGKAFAGFVTLNLRGPFSGYIQSVGVMPEFRNRGIGARLIAFAEKRIYRESPNVFLCVSSFNKAAQRFYKRLGYERVGELKDYVVRGHSEYLMRKTKGPMAEF